MAFHPSHLPLPMQMEWVKGPSNWKGLIYAACNVGLYKTDYLASVVFYLHHPERNYRPIDAHETSLIAEWKEWKRKIEDTMRTRPSPPPIKKTSPTPSEVDWSPDWAEIEQIRRDYGPEVADWAALPPDGVDAVEFTAPSHLKRNYGTIFVWKSASPSSVCAPNPKQRVQIAAILRTDRAYWTERTGGNVTAALSMSLAAETCLGDYREFIVERHYCPKAAFFRLVTINKNVTALLFLAMVQLANPAGVKNPWMPHSTAISSFFSKIAEPAINQQQLELIRQLLRDRIEYRRSELEKSMLAPAY
jgi:hypothetical protein